MFWDENQSAQIMVSNELIFKLASYLFSSVSSEKAKPQVSFSSIGSFWQTTSPHLRNPFAYVGRAVSKFDSVNFRNAKRPHCFKTHQRDLSEI